MKKEEKIRLNKFIASSGIASRRKADELILDGKVSVNGKIVTELGLTVSASDKVLVNNKPITEKKLKYFRFYKPSGYITTTSDESGRKTIYDILPEEMKQYLPVGRLDKDTTGLLILTNDGELINELTHPSIKVAKVYLVTAQGKVTKVEFEKMQNGIEIEKGKKAYAQCSTYQYDKGNTNMELVLFQGMNRQIRKTLDYLGHPVISLKRISHATINLDGLKRGDFTQIKPSQLRELKNYIKKIKEKSLVSDKIK